MNPASLIYFLHAAKTQVFQIGVVSFLGAIGFWGHSTHWRLTPSHSPSGDSSAAAEPATPTPLPGGKVHFPSVKSVSDLAVRTAKASRKSLEQQVTAAGVVHYEPTRLAQLSARCTGTVWRVEKQVGQSIKAGDVLAIVDGVAVGQAKADFLNSIADVELHEKAFERLRSLDKGLVPKKSVDEAETALRKSHIDMFNAQQALISLGLTVDLEQWQHMSDSELRTKIKFLGFPESLVAQFDPNATTASLLPILAPFNGVVIGRDMTIGEVVSPGKHQFEIADVSRVWIVIDVREQDANELQLGQKVVFSTDHATVTSAVSWISTAVDERTRTIEVRCEAENPAINNAAGEPTGNRLLRANVFGSAKICVRQSAEAYVMPTKAVQWFNDSNVIFVQTGTQDFEVRVVEVGIVTPEHTEITTGLSELDTVVIEGSHILKAELQRSAAGRPPT